MLQKQPGKILKKKGIEALYDKIKGVIEEARNKVYRAANFETVKGYWLIGRYIVEEEQGGKVRAVKGAALIKKLSERLILEYGNGFAVTNLKYMRQFFLSFPKSHALSDQISWTHYRTLLKISDKTAREFYMKEAIKARWGTRTLERAILTKLYERTLLSRVSQQSQEALLQETKALEGEEDFTPEYFIKDPYNLSFTGLKFQPHFQEKDLEQALMDKLQDFILELGHGFAFVGRQYRMTLEDDHFYVDLVFYNYILKCFLLIDLKTKKLTHEDIGQMQMYVGYFENEIRQKSDNPTIGLILCTDKNDKMVTYTLSENSKKIFASQYRMYLPSEEELKKGILE